jgi:cytochrome c oxidase cbb3-type subunit 1
MTTRPIAVSKATIDELIDEDHSLTKLIFAYAACASFWLLFGTVVGLLVAVKFVIPDFGVDPWLSFGRLRPIHTNVVFWGWTSLAMISLALYVVPKTSQRSLYGIGLAWISLVLINISVILGTLLLFSGVNNGGQEFREFIWPVMFIFAVGVVLLAINFYFTISERNTKEIYISNWYILGAFIWASLLVIFAYIPFYQRGLGQSVMQGYYMHNGFSLSY